MVGGLARGDNGRTIDQSLARPILALQLQPTLNLTLQVFYEQKTKQTGLK
jgi:hypothetical protein